MKQTFAQFATHYRFLSRHWVAPALLAAVLAVLAQRELAERNNHLVLADETRNAAAEVRAATTDGTVLGGAILMGLIKHDVKDLIIDKAAPQDSDTAGDFAGIVAQYDADLILVLSGKGDTMAEMVKGGKWSTFGRSLSFRPYWQRAMQGSANVYPAVGSNSHARGLYFAAPVYAGTTSHTPVIGAYVIKVPATHIDRLLDKIAHPALLVSPDGVVFATNYAPWLLKLATPITARRRAELIADRQFDQLFVGTSPERLPFSLDGRDIQLQGKTYAQESSPLDWQDGAGLWRLVVLQDKTEWLPVWQQLALACAALLAVLLCGQVVTGRRREIEIAGNLRKENEERMRQITDNLPVAVYQCRLDTDGRMTFLFLSPAIGGITGLSAAEVIADPYALIKIFHPDDRALLTARLTLSAEEDVGYHGQLRIIRRDSGLTRWIEIRSVTLVEDGGGRLWNGYIADVSAEHEAAQALQDAKRVAEDATRSKSMFLANMSHEIRTPMNAIIGLSYLALKTALNAKQADYIGKIHNAGTSLLGIINDILDFSKIEAGKLDLDIADFQLERVVDSVTTVIGHKVAEKNLDLVFDIRPEVPVALIGDQLRLGQIFINLIGNAVKFTEAGQILVTVESLERIALRIKLKVSVADSGIGMTKEQCERLFQAFTQADGSTTRKYGGTGLGLTISKRLVELMGGAIWVESEAGSGSTFQFTAWFGIAERADGAARRTLPEAMKGLRILIVDDNDMARHVLAGHCTSWHLLVDEVASGAEAISAVRQAAAAGKPYNLVLMDWVMPGMNGIEAAQIIKNDATLESASAPAIVMVTAFGREDVRADAENVAIDAFLVKPVCMSALFDVLAGLYGQASGGLPPVAKNADYRFDGLRILLAEDNEINQQIAVELLTGVGATVEVADNGRIVLEKLQADSNGENGSYDLVLLDLQMPELDGFGAAAAIRAMPAFSALPVIAMTAHAMPEERQRCLDAGMNDHLSKPIDPDVLFATLARWTDKKSDQTRGTVSLPDAAMPAIDGFDVQDGLRRVGGNAVLYRNLLTRFAAGNLRVAEQIADLLAASDRAGAERAAHSTRGVAANIGAPVLAAVAGRLEQAIREEREDEALLQEFSRIAAAAVAAVRAAVPDDVVVDDSDAALASAEVLQQLLDLLESGDVIAPDYFAAHRAGLMKALGTQAAGVERAIGEFEFDAALASVQEALRQTV